MGSLASIGFSPSTINSFRRCGLAWDRLTGIIHGVARWQNARQCKIVKCRIHDYALHPSPFTLHHITTSPFTHSSTSKTTATCLTLTKLLISTTYRNSSPCSPSSYASATLLMLHIPTFPTHPISKSSQLSIYARPFPLLAYPIPKS